MRASTSALASSPDAWVWLDVITAVKFARVNELATALRGGGHNVGGRALCEDGILIDLWGMRSVYVDSGTGTVRVQGGATLGDLDRETHVFGLAVPSGVVLKPESEA